MSDFYKPLGKDMHEEPSDKLFILESEGFVSAGFIVLDPEGNGFFTDLKDPGVADGDPVGVPAQVLNDMISTFKHSHSEL